MLIFTHFQLRKPPFVVSPDPDCFFLGPANEESWATLRFVAQTAGAGCLLLGPPGSGKSLHARKLTAVRRGKNACWLNGLSKPGPALTAAAAEAPDAPEMPLLQALRRTTQPLLIVDNASDLSPTRWNELLHCLESAENAGSRVTLVPVLDSERVRDLDPALVARLRHRCLRTAKLVALDRAECADYVRFRLTHAGGDGSSVFTTAALNRIFALSGGLPARIHLLCHNGLIQAFSEGRNYVTAEDIERGATALNLDWGRIVTPDLELPNTADDAEEADRAGAPAMKPEAAPAPLNLSLPSGAIWTDLPQALRPLIPEVSMPLVDLPRHHRPRKQLTPLRSSVSTVAEVWNQILDSSPRRPARDARRAPRVRPVSAAALLETRSAASGTQLEHAFPTNLSREGAAFLGERRYARNTDCTLWLLNRERRPTPVPAHVARSRAVGPTAGLYEIGVVLDRPLPLSDFVPSPTHVLEAALRG